MPRHSQGLFKRVSGLSGLQRLTDLTGCFASMKTKVSD